MLARRPLACPTVAAQVLATGTGALNVDGCRVGTTKDVPASPRGRQDRIYGAYGAQTGTESGHDPNVGRWPANLVHDGSPEVLAAFAAFDGGRREGWYSGEARRGLGYGSGIQSEADGSKRAKGTGDTGTAARFFPALGFGEDELRFHYGAKASKAERAGSKHPTVKPLALMRWLCRLVTPPGGTVLDCFAGSGTTGEAALLEGFGAVLVEREAEHVADIRRRLGCASGADTPLLSETAA